MSYECPRKSTGKHAERWLGVTVNSCDIDGQGHGQLAQAPSTKVDPEGETWMVGRACQGEKGVGIP